MYNIIVINGNVSTDIRFGRDESDKRFFVAEVLATGEKYRVVRVWRWFYVNRQYKFKHIDLFGGHPFDIKRAERRDIHVISWFWQYPISLMALQCLLLRSKFVGWKRKHLHR